MIFHHRSSIIITLLLFYGFGFIHSVKGFNKADSTLVYTLKENERIIYLSEHRLLVTNTGIGHLLFLSRTTGNFILFNGKEYGPYEAIGFQESNASLLDWAVMQGGKWYQLILDKAALLGPYDYVVDVYRSYENGYSYNSIYYTGSHYGFRARRGKDWFTIVDGKSYGPYAEEPTNGIPSFQSNGETVFAYLQDYDYNSTTRTYKSKGDSLVMEKITRSKYNLISNALYKDGVVIKDPVIYFEEDIANKNFLALDKEGVASINGNLLEGCPKAYISSYGYCAQPAFISTSGHVAVLHQQDDKMYYYLSKQKISVGPFADSSGDDLCFTNDAAHYANSKGTQILIDGATAHKKGFSLVHNPANDSFSWLSVKGRSIYLHRVKP